MPRLLTLGRFELVSDSDATSSIGIQPKRLALLAYLAAAPAGGASMHRRDTLLGLFWPELTQDDARRALRHALHHVRKAAGQEAIVARADDQVGVDPVFLQSDQADFERALADSRHEEALALYQGDFLRGVFVPDASSELENWIDRTRVRLRNGALEAARNTIEKAEAEGRDQDALNAAFRAHEIAPDDQSIIRKLLELMHRAGDKAGALRLYENFARRLQDEVGVSPEPSTVAMYEGLRRAPAMDRPSFAPLIPSVGPKRDDIPLLHADSYSISPTAAPRSRSALIALGVTVILLAVAGIAWTTRNTRGRKENETASIAVLPFEVQSKDTTTAFFADGMTEELGAALSRAGIRVAARSAVAALHAKPGGDAEILKVLGVGLLLHSRVERSRDRFRVWTQLVNGTDGIALWTRTYDTTMTDVFRVQEDLAQAIVREMRPSLGISAVRESSLSARGTNDVAAYESFMKGRYYTDRLDSKRAIEAFKSSIDYDPRFARAWAALGRAYANLSLAGLSGGDSLMVLASQAAGRAVQLDSTIADAYAASGVLLLNQWKFSAAENAFRHAISLEPDDPDNYLEYCSLLFILGRIDESLAEVQKMRELDPLSIGAITVKQYVLLMLGRWNDSRAETRAGLELDSTFIPFYQNAALTEAFAGKTDSALTLFKKGYDLDTRLFGNSSMVSFGYAAVGDWRTVDRLRASMTAGSKGNSPNFIQTINAVVDGNVPRAVDAMQRALDHHEPLFLFVSAACDPMFGPLHSDARYAALMARYGMRPCPVVGTWPIRPRP